MLLQLIILFLLRLLYGLGEGTTEGFTWRWVNQTEKDPPTYHFWREIVENMGRRLELLILYVIVFSWIGAAYFLVIEIAGLSIYELRIRYIIYDDWRYHKTGTYDLKILGHEFHLGYPKSTTMVLILAISCFALFPLYSIFGC